MRCLCCCAPSCRGRAPVPAGAPDRARCAAPWLVASSWPGWCFAINEIAASACPARPRGRFALKRCSTQSSTRPRATPCPASDGRAWCVLAPPFWPWAAHASKKSAPTSSRTAIKPLHSRPSRKARCLKNAKPTAVATPTEKRGFVTPKFRELVRLHCPTWFRAGWPQR